MPRTATFLGQLLKNTSLRHQTVKRGDLIGLSIRLFKHLVVFAECMLKWEEKC